MAEKLLATSGLISVLIAEIFPQIQLNMFFFDLLIPKVKPISTGNFYWPPNVNPFPETFFNYLKHINLHKNEVYSLGDFNVNLLLNDKFILKENQSLDFRNLSSPLVSKYKELYQTFSLKEIIQEAYSRNKQHFLSSWPYGD